MTRSAICPTLALTVLLTAAATADPGPNEPGDKIRLQLRDQYGGEVRYPPAAERPSAIVVVAVADRKGAEGNRSWAVALRERYREHLEGLTSPALEVLPVAHLDSVPRVLRGVVKRFFRGREPDGQPVPPIGLDWRGSAARQLGLVPGVPNLAVLDRDGRLRIKVAGQVESGEAQRLFNVLDQLLLPSQAAN